MTMSAPTPSHQQQKLAPFSAQTSLKRSRILFDTSFSSTGNNNSVNNFTAAQAPNLAAATEAFVPPLFDSQLHQQTIKRKIRLHYPGEYSKLTFQAEQHELDGNEIKASKKETATGRAVREIRREALDKLRSGEGAAVSGNSNDAGAEGRLVIHREVDMTSSSSASKNQSVGGALIVSGSNNNNSSTAQPSAANENNKGQPIRSGGILVKRDDDSKTSIPTPKWHAPWKLSTVLSSHLGWVRSIAFDPHNTMFATGGNDRVIKIFDLAKACVASQDALKITLTGHISPVRGLAFSDRHPYLFSAGEDKLVKCWDLETNQVIRHYHGHLSGVFALKMHPTLDLLVTGGR